MTLALIVILAVLVLLTILLVYQLFWGTPLSIHWAVERLALKMMAADPETLTILGVIDNTFLDFHSDKLTDASPHYMAQLRQLDREGLALIRRYDPITLTGQKRITYHLMRWYFENNLRGHHFNYHWVANPVFMGPYPVNHIFGVQIDLINFLNTYHAIRGRRSARRYLQRLGMIEWKLAGLQESLKMREDEDVFPPRFVIEKSLAQIHEFLSNPIDENPLYQNFVNKAEQSGRFNHRALQQWGQRVENVLESAVYPSYQRLQSFLSGMLEKATTDDGVWKLPEGLAYYDFLLRTHTTTQLSAGAIHQLGLDEVDHLTEKIKRTLDALGVPSEEPGLTLIHLMADPKYHFSGDDSRQEIIDAYQTILDEVNQRMPEVFSRGAMEQVIVRRLPEYKEPDSPIAYAQPPSIDGNRPGTLWVNLREPGNVYRWGMRTLAFHEAIPGHVYQMAQAQRIRGLPTFRRTYFYNAYLEGWALYAERLGWELGLEDTLSNLGRLQALIWRAARLVVDTGIHVMHWTREEAIAYMIKVTGLPERDVTTEVERYIVMPGQACAYYIGYLKMIALRQKAEATLGEAFDLKDFHDVILNNGGLPLELLEMVVNDYVDQKAGLLPADPS